MKTLIVEDDFTSRVLLQSVLSRYGECHAAVNGAEAVEAVRLSMQANAPYHLICMDIMMPEMDGQQAVKEIRSLEQERGILSSRGAKIIMTTAVDDMKQVIRSFQELCDAYLVKPVTIPELVRHLKDLRLI